MRAIVLTDRRILLLQIHGGDRPGVFTRVRKGDAKFLRSLIERLQAAGVTEGAPVTGHEHLCPHCYAVAGIGQVE